MGRFRDPLGSICAPLLMAALTLALGCDQGGKKGDQDPGAMIDPPPRVTAIAPTSSLLEGGGTAVLRGLGFQAEAEVHFGSQRSPRVTRISTAELRAEIPPADVPGPVDITVRNPSGQSTTLVGRFFYDPYPPPELSSISPATGNARRNMPIEVRGGAFRPGARLFLESREISPVQVLTEGLLAVEFPPMEPGLFDLTVENSDGQRATLPKAYEAALMRDTPIAAVHVGRLADLLDSSLEPSATLLDRLISLGLEERPGLWRYLPDDPLTGKTRVLIEAPRGTKAWQETLASLSQDLLAVPSWGYSAPGKPPVLPRDGALRITFDGDLGIAPDFWTKHPGSVHLLVIEGDPVADPKGALRELPCTRLGSGTELLLVPVGPTTPFGLPAAPKGIELATIRIAFALEGPESVPTLEPDRQTFLVGKDHLGQASLVRDFRTAREGEDLPGAKGGLLTRSLPPTIQADLPVTILAVDPSGRVTIDKLGLLHSIDPFETLVQDQGSAGRVALLVRASEDTPATPIATVEVAGGVLLEPGPALLRCSYRHGVDDGAAFVRVDPPPDPAGIAPLAGFELDFGEPVGGHVALEGWILSAEADPNVVADPKLGTPGLVPVGLQGAGLEVAGRFTKLRVTPLLGLPHRQGRQERFTLHLLEQAAGEIESLSGRPFAEKGFTATFQVDPDQPDLPVVYLVRRFLAEDEDGTHPAALAPDWWGPGRVEDGRLHARPFARMQARTDPQALATIERGGVPTCVRPFPLYRTPNFDFLGKGGVPEPLLPGGSRLQATWREDDLGLSRTDPAQMHLEVEGLALAPFDPAGLVKELLDSITLDAGHAAPRPDLRPRPESGTGLCEIDPASFGSGLGARFAANFLGQPVRLLDGVAWLIDPLALRRDPTGRPWLPLPSLGRTLVFRDLLEERRGGALCGTAPTLDVESPWAGDSDPRAEGAFFAGDRVGDHRTVALPLLLDFFVPPSDPWHAAPFLGANRFRTGHVLGPWPGAGHGLYAPQPAFRAHTSAGPQWDKDPPIDPFVERNARGGFEWGGFLGSLRVPHPTPPTDDHLPWLQVDFLARTTVVTFGFVDLTDPSQAAWTTDPEHGIPVWPPGWRPTRFMLPELDSDLPPGTALEIQWRGAHTLPVPALWNPLAQDDVPLRGNILNPLYACDANRLSQRGTLPAELTEWVDDPDELIDPATGRGPRYLCWRVLMQSAEGVKAPSLGSLILGALLVEGF